jgi:dipeptidyl aminopeptidase/acylaminoacyl peptidase
MRHAVSLVMVVCMSTLTISQTLPAPQAVTDPKQIAGKNNLNVAKLSIEKLYMTRAIGGSSWSPDGKTIAFISNISGRNNLWTVPAAGGWPVQLTVSDQRQSSPAWSPDGKWIAYISDYDGDEMWDVYMVSTASGEVVNLTNTREIAEIAPRWSPDGRELAWEVKPKTSSTWEIDIFDMAYRKVSHLTTGTPPELSNGGFVWSHDGKQIAYTQSHAAGKDSNVFVADVETAKSIKVTEHAGEQHYRVNDFSPDGKHLLITSDAANGYSNVALLDIATKKIEWLTHDKWEIDGRQFTPNGKTVLWEANVDGNTDIYWKSLGSANAPAMRLPLPKGVNSLGGSGSAFAHMLGPMLYYHNGPNAPNDLWTYELELDGAINTPVTHSLVAGVKSEDMVEPQLIHYPSRDGKWQISAFVYVPYNLPRNAKNPAIVYVHGGPTSQTVNSFNRIVQYVVNQGYLVISPNYRGSTGYGKEFQEANFKDMGGGDLEDTLAAADWIQKTGYVDPKKLIIMGGSYGGYLSMMAVTKAPEVWAAGVPIVPFVNWFTEIENEDPSLQQWDLATMGDPKNEKDQALLRDRSPIFFVDKIKAPLFLLAGGNDPRCPKEEAQQVADAVKKNGGQADLKIYENEGHGFARVENQIDAYRRVAEFLKAKVPPQDCSCTVEP